MDKMNSVNKSIELRLGKDEQESQQFEVNVCACCKEVWSDSNMSEIILGENTLHLCPECYSKLKLKLFSALELFPVTEKPENGTKCLVLSGDIYETATFVDNLYDVDKYDFCDCKNKSGWFELDAEYGFYEVTGVTGWLPLPGKGDI